MTTIFPVHLIQLVLVGFPSPLFWKQTLEISDTHFFLVGQPRVCPGQSLLPLIPSLPHLLLYPLVSFAFPLFPFLLASSIFYSITSHSTRVDPLYFQARCRRRLLNLALFFVVFVSYVFFSKGCVLVFVVFDLVLSCSVIVVSPCCVNTH